MELDGVLFKEIAEHGLRAFPNEACGLVAGVDRIDAEGWDLLGIVHTHTHSEAYPSETDRKLAFYPEALYLVMSLADRERPVLRAFRIEDGDVREEELQIT